MGSPDLRYGAKFVDGLATAETDALMEKVHEWHDLSADNAELLDDNWEKLADAEEQRRAVDELRAGKTPGKGRMPVREEWAVKRAHVLARLKLIQEDVTTLDRATSAAIVRDAKTAVGPAMETLESRMAGYEQAAQDLKRAAADLRAAITRANLVKGIAAGKPQSRIDRNIGTLWVDDDHVNYQVSELLLRVKPRVKRMVAGVRFMAGDSVLFSTPSGVVQSVLTEDGAARLNAQDVAGYVAAADLPTGSVPLMNEGVPN